MLFVGYLLYVACGSLFVVCLLWFDVAVYCSCLVILFFLGGGGCCLVCAFRSLRLAVCCLLFVVCCLLFVVCCLLLVVCCCLCVA